ncbi:MAG: hypothetical protein GX455_11835 [Phycisphaerae bacterium]|nr:hypothetical protein [Phycisphaerae bacterium]
MALKPEPRRGTSKEKKCDKRELIREQTGRKRVFKPGERIGSGIVGDLSVRESQRFYGFENGGDLIEGEVRQTDDTAAMEMESGVGLNSLFAGPGDFRGTVDMQDRQFGYIGGPASVA